jgi:hypothetical protein
MFVALVGDINGRIIGEVQPTVGEISWRINGVGQVPFSLPTNSQYLTNDFMRFGNTILFKFSNGLPNWGGIIDPPLKGGETAVSFTAYSAEILMSFRTTTASRYFSSANVGYIFSKIIEEANAIQDTGLRVTRASYSGGSNTTEYHFTSLLDVIKNSLIRNLSSYEFRVTAKEEAGYIKFDAEIYEQLGSSRPGIALVEGRNANMGNEYEEQGPIVNKHTAVGSGNTWGSSRPMATAVDGDSQHLYRLRETSVIYSDIGSVSTLQQSADNLSKQYSRPRRVVSATLLDHPPARFSEYDVGDTIQVSFPNAGIGGFNSIARLISRAFDPTTNTCKAILEETS